MSRRALILGTLPGQLDAVEALHADGWTVFTCGHRTQSARDVAADGFHLVDLLDADAITDLARHLEVDLVYSVGSDIAMPTVADVSARLGLPGFHGEKTTRILHRKDLLRTFLDQAGLSPVVYRLLRTTGDLAAFDAYPAVVKPADSQGQRGITLVADEEAARRALPTALAASPTGNAVLEEYLAGPEISVHVVVVDGSVRLFVPSDRHVWQGPLVGVPAAHTLPSAALDVATERDLRELVRRFVAELDITNGPLYLQVKLTAAGPRIIEVAPRLDGCHLWRLVRTHTGFDLLRAVLRLLTGEPWEDPAPWDDTVAHTLRFHLATPGRPFHAADHRTSGEIVLHEEFHVPEGALPRDTNGLVARVGYVIVEGPR
jgi:biotin carboxylase